MKFLFITTLMFVSTTSFAKLLVAEIICSGTVVDEGESILVNVTTHISPEQLCNGKVDNNATITIGFPEIKNGQNTFVVTGKKAIQGNRVIISSEKGSDESVTLEYGKSSMDKKAFLDFMGLKSSKLNCNFREEHYSCE